RREQAERILLPQVVLGRERQASQILDRSDVIRRNAGEPPPVEFGSRRLEPRETGSHPSHLQPLERVPRHGLRRTIPEAISRHPCAPSTPCGPPDALR